MSDDELALLRTICDDPEDDVARLVYADWIEERGQIQRAEFIRRQINGHYAEDLFDTAWLPDCEGRLREWYFHQYPPNHVPDRPYSFCIDRGFISEIRCDMATFMDRECMCQGSEAYPRITSCCTICHGTGTLAGLARTLFAVGPVTRVVLADKEPSNVGGWYWYRADGEQHRHRLRYDLFKHLSKSAENGDTWIVPYHTREAALDALSQACVNYARNLYGYKMVRTNRSEAK